MSAVWVLEAAHASCAAAAKTRDLKRLPGMGVAVIREIPQLRLCSTNEPARRPGGVGTMGRPCQASRSGNRNLAPSPIVPKSTPASSALRAEGCSGTIGSGKDQHGVGYALFSSQFGILLILLPISCTTSTS